MILLTCLLDLSLKHIDKFRSRQQSTTVCYYNIFRVDSKYTKTMSNAGWAWEIIVSDNESAFSSCEKYIVLWAGEIC